MQRATIAQAEHLRKFDVRWLPRTTCSTAIAERQRTTHDAALAFVSVSTQRHDRAHLADIKARMTWLTRSCATRCCRSTSRSNCSTTQNQLLQLQQRVDQQVRSEHAPDRRCCWRSCSAAIGYWAYKIKRVQLSLRRFAETDALTRHQQPPPLHPAGRAVARAACEGQDEARAAGHVRSRSLQADQRQLWA